MTSKRDPQKKRCTSCQKTLYFYDSEGIHIKCGHCKHITTFSWEDLAQMYLVTHQDEYMLFAHLSA